MILSRTAKVVRLPRIELSVDTLLMVLAVAALVYLIAIPLIMTVFSALRGPADYLPFESGARYTLQNLARAYGSVNLWLTFRDTLVFALGSVALALAIGFSLAWLVERTDIPFRNAIFVIAVVPIMMPGITIALAWIFMLGPAAGLVNVMIRDVLGLVGPGPLNIFTMYGMVLVQGFGMSTLMFLLLSAAMRNMDPSMEEAAAASGAPFFRTIRRVTMPLLTPAILSALILSFIFAIETFEVPLLIGLAAGVRVFALDIFWTLNPAAGLPRYGQAAALSLSFLALTYLMFYLYARVTRLATRYATVTGKGYRPRRIKLGRWRYVALAGVLLYSLLQIVFPVTVLAWTSFTGLVTPPSLAALERLSLASYQRLFDDQRFFLSIRNTFVVAFGSAVIVSLISSVVAWITVRTNIMGKRLLDFLASSSIAIPGVIAGLAFLIFYLSASRWIPVYGTIWVLVLAYSYRLSLAYWLNVAGLTQISKELEDAGKTSGAPWRTVFRRVVVPLQAPTFIVVFITIFFLGFRDFTLAVILGSRENVVMSVYIWQFFANNDFGAAAAMSVITLAILFICAILLRGVLLRRLGGRNA